jgi:GntR family transcriptional regulator
MTLMNFQKEIFRIDPQSKLPLYDQIERNLRDLIINGKMKPGEMMPSEWELVDLYGVSRLTVRRAVDELVRQNWLERKHGVGTFVCQPVTASISASKLSFTEQMKAIGRNPGSRLVNKRVTPATSKISRLLRIQEGEPIIEITRVRLADDTPILLETSCLSANRYPALESLSWTQNESLYKILKDQYGVTVIGLDHTLKPVLLTETEARYLKSRAGAPAILSEIVAFTRNGTPLEYVWSLSNGEKSEFYFHFLRVEQET